MKPVLIAFMATLLTIPLSCAHAASTVNLSVTGTITPIACTPVFSKDGQIDLGKISRQELNVDKRTRLGDETLQFTLHCSTPARLALRMRDNRDGSAIVNSEIYYGLDFDRSGNKIGLYSLHFDPASTQVDSWPLVYRTDSTTGGRAWSTSRSDTLPIAARSYLGFTNIAGSTAGPIALSSLSSRVTLQTVIAPTSELDLSSEIELDGSATLEVVYL